MDTLIHQINACVEGYLRQENIHFTGDDFERLNAAYAKNKHYSTGVNLSHAPQRGLYVACRMPATTAVMQQIFAQLPADFLPETLCDLGGGSGSAVVAAGKRFPALTDVTIVDENPHLLCLAELFFPLLAPQINVRTRILSYVTGTVSGAYDLVTLSYTLNEIPESCRELVVTKAWHMCKGMLVIAEPGSPKGFDVIMQIRDWACKHNIHVYAPCSHHGQCPLRVGDWCHFHARFPRSTRLRQLKGASLGYEDEPYSYLVLSRQEYPPQGMRIIEKPRKFPHGLTIKTCSPEHVHTHPIRKKNPLYKSLKKSKRGDLYQGPITRSLVPAT